MKEKLERLKKDFPYFMKLVLNIKIPDWQKYFIKEMEIFEGLGVNKDKTNSRSKS